MSRYSGKFDFCDELEMLNPSDFSDYEIRLGIRLGRDSKPLNITSISDCIPYFTHIVSASCCSEGKHHIWLDEYSWLRREREKYGVLTMHSFYRKAINELCEKYDCKKLYRPEECESDFYSNTNKLGPLFFIESKVLTYRNKYVTLCKNEDDFLFLLLGSYAHPNKFLICKITSEDLEKIKNKSLSLKEFYTNNISEVYFSRYDIETDSLVLRHAGKSINSKYFF